MANNKKKHSNVGAASVTIHLSLIFYYITNIALNVYIVQNEH